MTRCAEQIAWYESHSRSAWRWFAIFQSVAIGLGAVTPVLILWTALPKPIQALPAAVASVAAGLVGTYGWLDAKARYAYAAESLKSERVLFATRTPPYGRRLGDEEATRAFVAKIEQIAMTEVGEWRSAMARTKQSSG